MQFPNPDSQPLRYGYAGTEANWVTAGTFAANDSVISFQTCCCIHFPRRLVTMSPGLQNLVSKYLIMLEIAIKQARTSEEWRGDLRSHGCCLVPLAVCFSGKCRSPDIRPTPVLSRLIEQEIENTECGCLCKAFAHKISGEIRLTRSGTYGCHYHLWLSVASVASAAKELEMYMANNFDLAF